MDVASASSALANGIIADQWATVASLQKRDMSPEDLAKLTEALGVLCGRTVLFCQPHQERKWDGESSLCD